jgi:hypothetical protein
MSPTHKILTILALVCFSSFPRLLLYGVFDMAYAMPASASVRLLSRLPYARLVFPVYMSLHSFWLGFSLS